MTEGAKILIVTDAWHPQINGVVRTYEHLSAELEKAGHTIRVIGPGDFPLRMPMPGYREIDLTLFPAGRLRRLIASHAPDYLHIATEGPLGWAARREADRQDWRWSSAYHTQFPAYVSGRVARYLPGLTEKSHIWATDFIRRFHHEADGMVVTTPSLEAELKALAFQTPMYALPRGVRLETFSPGPATLFADLPRPVALYVGRVAIEKNLENFLAMPWTGSKVIVGEGPEKAALARRYPQARFVGTKTGDDLAAHYRSADLFVFPSKTDTFGIVLVEALACGLPVAAYDVTGPRDIITRPDLGALERNDLAAAAKKALTAPGTKESRFAHVQDLYGWPAIAERFMAVLQEIGPVRPPGIN